MSAVRGNCPRTKATDSRSLPRPQSLVIFASGYKQDFSNWLAADYPRPWDATMRDIIKPEVPDVAFVGFVRPGVGESATFLCSCHRLAPLTES